MPSTNWLRSPHSLLLRRPLRTRKHQSWLRPPRRSASSSRRTDSSRRCREDCSQRLGRRRKQVDEALREAVSSLNDVRESIVREIQELFPTRVEAMKFSPKEEFAGEIASHWKEQMKKYRGQAEEMAQRLEKQAAELRRQLAQSQEVVERMTREREPQIHARLNEAVPQATSQFETATARFVDRRYQLLLENTQAVTQEALLKLDARSAGVQARVER